MVRRGPLLRHGTKFTSRGTRALGAFSFTPLHHTAAIDREFGQFAHGARYSSDDFSGDEATGTAESSGLQIIRFSSKGAGEICISTVSRYSRRGALVTNSFSTLGGTGKGARLIASGTYRTTNKAGGEVSARGTGTASLGPARALPPSCVRLKRSFGLH